MRSLFFRVFLWFWVSIVVVVVVLVVSSPFFTRNRPRVARWEQHARERALGFVEKVSDDIERRGLEAVERPFEPRNHDPRRRDVGGPPAQLLVFDEAGNERTGQPPDPEAARLAERTFESQQTVSQRIGSHHFIASPVTAPGGEAYVVVAKLRRPPSLVDLLEPKILLPRIALLAAVAGLLVLWLAYQLSSPVAALRTATRQLAAGDLGARVGPPISRRGDEIGQLATDFDTMAERIEAQVQAQQRLIRDVSHELRSPLARLNVALGLARRNVSDETAAHLDRVERECNRLNEMISHLLDLSRREQSIEPETEVDLVKLVTEVVEDARFEAGSSAVSLRIATESEPKVQGRRDLLRSAVDNVLRNAIAFGPADSAADVELDADGTSTLVRVSDRGPGVPDADLERIFTPFFRVEVSRDRSRGGAGLGLAIAKRAVARHGGEIAAANRQGGGLVVEIRLPTGEVGSPHQ